MTAVILIPGFLGTTFEFFPIINVLKKNGFNKIYTFNYNSQWGKLSISKLAKDFANFVNKKVEEKRVKIIAISQGGIIARLFIRNNKGKEIVSCITLCTPHHGTLMAYLSNRAGIVDLRPGSKLLRGLNGKSRKVRFYCVYNPIDLIILPGKSARFEKARINKMVLAPSHMFTFWRKPTLSFILECLRRD